MVSPFSFSITSFTLTSFTVDSEEIPLPPVQRGQLTSQGRSPTVKPVAVLVTIKVYLKYRVASLGTKTRIRFKVTPEPKQKPLIKYGSAIMKIVAKPFIPIKAASKPVPLSYHTRFYIQYKVDCLHVKSVCTFKVDKLISHDQQLKAAAQIRLASYYSLYLSLI